jgi:hypothetical protein
VLHRFYHESRSQEAVTFTTWYDKTWSQGPHAPGSRYTSVGIHPIAA